MDLSFTDFDDAYATRINPIGASPVGGGPGSGTLPPPAVQSNPNPVVVMPSMTVGSSTVPVYPSSVPTGPVGAKPASASHGVYSPAHSPYIDSASLAPPADTEPGYFERMGMRRKDMVKLLVLAMMVALGISMHWVASHYVTEWMESSDFDAKQRLAIRLAYPAAIGFVLWNIKAFQ